VTTSENLIPFESVSTPLGREAPSVGLVGDGGEKKRREGEAVGGGLDASVTPGKLMVDETRRSMGPLANWTFLGDKVPVHNMIRSHHVLVANRRIHTLPQPMEMLSKYAETRG
jgi:hypothetical protein